MAKAPSATEVLTTFTVGDAIYVYYGFKNMAGVLVEGVGYGTATLKKSVCSRNVTIQ